MINIKTIEFEVMLRHVYNIVKEEKKGEGWEVTYDDLGYFSSLFLNFKDREHYVVAINRPGFIICGRVLRDPLVWDTKKIPLTDPNCFEKFREIVRSW